MPPIQPSPRFEKVKDLGSGNFGLARLEREVATGQLVAIKYLPRGPSVDENVAREMVCHRMLRHKNVVLFKEVLLTPSHLAIVMEYAAGGELFDRICSKGRFSEDEARYFFRQLIAGVAYIHSQSVAHRDLKLENALLDGSDPPVLKICDFGYSKSSLLHSAAKSTVGTPAYIAPEVLSRQPYDGARADVWSCGVTLFVMLVGAYPFEDPAAPKDFRSTIARIMAIKYSYPQGLKLTPEVKDLLAKVFVLDPSKRLTVPGIVAHPWFGGGRLDDLVEGIPAPEGMQSTQDIAHIVGEARDLGNGAHGPAAAGAAHGQHGAADDLPPASTGGMSDEFAPEYLDADDGFPPED